MTDLADLAREALKQVFDPEAGVNIVDLGLVYDIAEEDGGVRVVMTFTSEGCPAASHLLIAVEEAIANLPGSPTPDVRVTFDPPLEPEMITADGRALLGQ